MKSFIVLAHPEPRSLDAVMSGETEPEWVANPETEIVNLEHILPKSPGRRWKVDPDVAAANLKRLGNMALMLAKKNTDVGDSSFEEKRKEYKDSSFLITSGVAKYAQWTPKEIDERQAKLAKIAVSAWPVDLKGSNGSKPKRA